MKRKTPRLLRQQVTHDGYMRVALSKEGKMKHITVHRLVAMAFCQIPIITLR